MTLRPILKAMPKYRRRQKAAPPSSFNYSPSSTPTSPDPLPFSSSSPFSSNPSSPRASSFRSASCLHLSSLPSPRLSSPLSSPLVTSPHVHFPPTPAISSTQLTHSASTYDRAPIEVSPNSCELPERGGRVYDVCSPDSVHHAPRTGTGAETRALSAPKGSYFHPNAFEACETERDDAEEDDSVLEQYELSVSLSLSSPLSSPSPSPSPSYFSPNYATTAAVPSSSQFLMPPLTHDISSASSTSCSESEDSDLSPAAFGDGCFSPHPYIQTSYPSSPYPLSGLSGAPDAEEFAYALSFLPSSPHLRPKGSPHPHKLKRKFHSKRTLKGDQTPKLSSKSRVAIQDEWSEAKLDGCLGGF